MVVGVWELVLFLWNHPIISCLVLVLFSPPFFPIIVYFSPLLVCTGLVAVAMISMNMGERAAVIEDWRHGTRPRPHEPAAAHHNQHGEMPEKPAREGWLQWMKKKEEKAKAWIDGRFLNQDKWQFRTSSALIRPEEESNAFENDSDERYLISSYRVHPMPASPTPILTSRDIISAPQTEREVSPPLSADTQASSESSHSVPTAEDIKPITPVEVPMEDSSFSFPIVEQKSLLSLVLPLPAGVEEEILEDGIGGVPSLPKQEKAPPVEKVETLVFAVEKEMASAPKAEILVKEQPTAGSVTEAPLVSPSQEEVRPPTAGIHENGPSQLPEEGEGSLTTKQEKIPQVGESVTSEDSRAFVSERDQATKEVEALLVVGSETTSDHPEILVSLDAVQNAVEDETSKSIPIIASSHGSSRLIAVKVLVEDRKASPEAEVEIFSPSTPAVLQPTLERFITTEKIIFIDELSKCPAVQSRSSMVAEAAGQVEAGLIIDKSIAKVVMLVTEEPPNESGSKNLKDRSPEDDHGLDENIESCADIPLPSSTTSTAASAILSQNSESLALVKRSSSEGFLSETTTMVPSSAAPPNNDLVLLTEYMEPMMSSIYNDAALLTSGSVLDKSYSLNTAFTGGGEEHDDLMARFYELKKSMSFHTATKRLDKPISLTVADAANVSMPVYVPDPTVTRVDMDPLEETLVFPEKKLPRPGLSSSGSVESVESITARLLSKFTPTLGSDAVRTRPPNRPVPALPAIAAASSVVTDKSLGSLAIAPALSVESDESLAVAPALPVQFDKKLAIAPASSVESDKELALAPDSPVESDEKPEVAPTSSAESDVSLAIDAPASSVESNKSPEAASTSVESEKSVEKGTGNLVPPIDVATVAVVKTNSHSKKSLTAFLSRRRDRLMSSSQLMEPVSVSGEGEKECSMSLGGTVEPVISAEISTEDPDEGSTTTSSGRHLKEKMISPLKRVFSMDASSGSNRKEDSWRNASVKCSPVKEKQSVIDKSKGRFKRLFTSDGGVTKLEAVVDVGKVAEPDAISLRKSKSTSITGGQKVVEVREDNEEVQEAMSLPSTPKSGGPSTEGNGMTVNEGVVDSEKLALPVIEAALLLPVIEAAPLLPAVEAAQLLPVIEAAPLLPVIEAAPFLPVIEAAFFSETADLVTSKSEQLPTSSASAEETMPATVVETGEQDDFAKGRVIKQSLCEKKKSWSWTKKKRISEPQDQSRRSPDRSVWPRQALDEESKVILMSPLTRFHSSSAAITSTVDEENPVTADPLDENHASDFKFSRPDLNSNLRDSPKADSSVHKKSSTSWWSSKTEPPPPSEKVEKVAKVDKAEKAVIPPKAKNVEKVEKAEKAVILPKAKKVSSSWWSRKSSNRADSKALPFPEVPPTDNITTDGLEKSGLLPSSSPTTARTENYCKPRNDFFSENSSRLRNDIFPDGNNDDAAVAAVVAPRPGHRRERSESLPSRGRFSRLRGRQTSLSDFTLPRTPELLLSPWSSSSARTAIDNNNSSSRTAGGGGVTFSSRRSTSIPRTDEDVHHHQLQQDYVKAEKRNSDPLDSSRSSSSRSNNLGWRSKYPPTPPSPSLVRTLDLANEQLRVKSPFHRSDLDVNNSSGSGSSRLYRNSPAHAQIRITDKFKVPLEEVLSLLSTGDSDEQHHLTTADNNRTTTGGAVAGHDRWAASSSSSSEDETSSEEEWSASSDDEDEKPQESVVQEQFTPLVVPAPGRIRPRLPHYIFSRGEPTAN